MSGTIPRPEAGPRLSFSEVMAILRPQLRGTKKRVPTLGTIRTEIAAKRCRRYLIGEGPNILTMTQAAFLLCRSRAYVRSLIVGGELSAEYISESESDSGTAHWRIPADEVFSIGGERD